LSGRIRGVEFEQHVTYERLAELLCVSHSAVKAAVRRYEKRTRRPVARRRGRLPESEALRIFPSLTPSGLRQRE